MTDWEKRFGEHAARQALATAEEEHSAAYSQAEEGPPTVLQDHERIGHLLRRVKQEFHAADPLAATESVLNAIQNNLNKGAQELKNFRANGNHQHLTNANTHVENALVQAGNLPKVETVQDVESLQEAVVSFRRSVGQHVSNVDREAAETRQELQDTKEALAEIQSVVQQEKKRTDEALRRFETQFSEAEAERRKETQQALTKLQNQASELEQRFLSSQEARQEKFSQAMQEEKERAKEAANDVLAAREVLEKEFRAEVQTYLDDLSEKKKAAEKIVGAVAQTGMAGGYQKIANEEQKTTRIWQVITVVSILGFVALMLFVVPSPAGGTLEWSEMIGRTLAALGLGGLAAYAGREAARHSERERHNRRLELEIASVGPFLAELRKEERDTVIKEVADRTFGRGTHPLSTDEQPVTTNGLLELLRMTVSELVKRVR